MTALQELPVRQRAVLILRDVVQFSAAEVAELLETTPAAVNSSLQRARAHLAEVSPAEENLAEPDDAERRELLDRYCAAFENADMAALTALLQADVKLEMPPLPTWFTGRDTVVRFLVAHAFTKPGDVALIPTAANGQPAVAEYRRTADGVMRAHSIHVLTAGLADGAAAIAALTVFLDPALFTAFGLPPSR
jgi:RNA polymerase sigma-70 factor (ECF subfamily)